MLQLLLMEQQQAQARVSRLARQPYLFVQCFRMYTSSGDSLQDTSSFLRWHKEWKIICWEKDKRKEKSATSFKTYLKLELTEDSIGIGMAQKLTSPVSQFGPGIVCSIRANMSQGKHRDHGWPICTWAHAPIVTFNIETTEETRELIVKYNSLASLICRV
jgi:hypothetical protein